MNEHDSEPVRGLPEHLPAGEAVLWQGAPAWDGLACRAFHVRKLAAYFGLLLAWRVVAALSAHALAEATVSIAVLTLVAIAALGVLTAFAWLIARTTVYTVTTRRIVIRFGVALPMTVNIPFSAVRSAGFKCLPDGSGDIQLALAERVSYLVMWPHVRPWHFFRAEPLMRSVPQVQSVAAVLGRALSAAIGASAQPLPDATGRSAAATHPNAAAVA
jgi:hypothetical protein